MRRDLLTGKLTDARAALQPRDQRGASTARCIEPVIYLPFVLLLLAVLSLWVQRNLALSVLALSVAVAYYTGALQGSAALWIVLLGGLAWLHASRTGLQRLATGVAFFVFAVALGLLLFPGFRAPRSRRTWS